jgi:transposase
MRIDVGIDAAKTTHWAVGVDEAGRVVLDRPVENDSQKIDALVGELRALGNDRGGEAVIGPDVAGSFAHFLEAMLLAQGFPRVHTPGIAVNRAGQGFAGGERKSDRRDARTIAELVRTRDLVEDQTRRLARLRGLLCGSHPGLERVLDVANDGPLVLLSRYVTPAEIRRAGQPRIAVPGEAATADLIRELAIEAVDARAKIPRIDADLEAFLADHPDGAIIRSLPGMGAVLTGEFIASTGDSRRYASAAGLFRVQRQSGKRAGWRRSFGGDKALKRVFYQSAFCAVATKDPISRAF